MFRIGLGQDSHRLQSTGVLVLGGVVVDKTMHCEADSDGDVILHSLCNALSTAIGGGSLDTWAGKMYRSGVKNSKEFLIKILKKIREQGYQINNISVIVEAGKPRLEPWREKMQSNLAKIIGIDKEQIGIAFTSGQNLTVFGKGKGIQVFSVVLIEK
jgi:2-C-methyl-D-erythritol 2,4-cyclodiphosphate synthase